MYRYAERVLGRMPLGHKVSIYRFVVMALEKEGRRKKPGCSDKQWAWANAAHINGKPARALETKLKTAMNPLADAFLSSYEWRRVRMQALKRYGARCQCCGASPADGAVMNVDHIKPRRLFPHLALDLDNLQVLCAPCNHGKGNWDQTDWREGDIDPEVKSFIRSIAQQA